MEKKRPPLETKEIGIKRLKECYEKNTRSICPPEKVREFERQYEREILPRVYENEKGR